MTRLGLVARRAQDGKIVPFHMLCSGHDALRAMFSACQDKAPYQPGTNKALYAIDWFAANPNLPVPWNVIGIEVGYAFEIRSLTVDIHDLHVHATRHPWIPSTHRPPLAVGCGRVWGGSCTCPNGQVYQVSDEGNMCGSMAVRAALRFDALSYTLSTLKCRGLTTSISCARSAWAASKAIAIGVKAFGPSARSSALHWTTRWTGRSGRTARSWVTPGR
jgi:hypothetical protein